ncbi:MAG: formylglycine-generating enzyme family protein [Treponema sp.]
MGVSAEDIKDIIATWIDPSTVTIPEGFVEVTGTTITGSENWTPSSDVFISGRSITIPDMYVCDHEVTQAEYEKYCKYGSESPRSSYGDGDNYPAYYVNWYDAIVYCNLRSIDEGLTLPIRLEKKQILQKGEEKAEILKTDTADQDAPTVHGMH